MSLKSLRQEEKETIGEVEALIPKRISEFKTILEKEIVVHPSSFDEFYLRFLRAKKYDLQRAALLFKKFCRLRTNGCGELISTMRPSALAEVIKSQFFSGLKTRDALGRQVAFMRMEKWNSKNVTFDDALMTLFMMMDEMNASPDTQLFGFVVILDYKTLDIWHAAQVRPSRLRVLIKVLQDSYPARFKEFHIINTPHVFGPLFSLASIFMKDKIRKRIHFHGSDMSSLHNMLKIDPSQLPEFVGGSLSDKEYDDPTIAESLLTKDAYYEELFQFGYILKN